MYWSNGNGTEFSKSCSFKVRLSRRWCLEVLDSFLLLRVPLYNTKFARLWWIAMLPECSACLLGSNSYWNQLDLLPSMSERRLSFWAVSLSQEGWSLLAFQASSYRFTWPECSRGTKLWYICGKDCTVSMLDCGEPQETKRVKRGFGIFLNKLF